MNKYFLILSMAVCLGANTNTGAQSCREFQVIRHNINQVEMCISNFGQFGKDETGSNYGCWWPAYTNQNYIWGAGIWFGTIDSLTGDTLVTIGYGPSSGQSEFVPGLNNMPINHPNAIIYMYPANWPAPQDTFPMAPQDTVSHQDSWCCFNDCDSNYHMPGDTRPIGIEVYQTVYDWDIIEVEDMIFLTYDIKNVSGHNLHNCYLGIATDCDIGNEAGVGNDICTFIIERTYIINSDTIIIDDVAYQWQDEEETGWNSFPGVIGIDLLQTPFDLEWGQDKDNDGIPDQYERDSSYYWNNLPPEMWDVDNDGVPDWRDASENPQLGMTAYRRFTLDIEPHTDPERYLTLAGYNIQTGQYEPYDTIIPDPDDQRYLMSSGPFDLEPDEVVRMLVGVMCASREDADDPPDTALVPVDKWAQLYYDMYWFLYTGIKENTCIERPNTELTILPNPVSRCAKISFSLSTSDMVSLKLYNTAGQLVKKIMREHMSAGKYNINLNTKGLSRGTYFLLLETPDSKTSKSLVILH
ncbi:MAG: T9SS type A sorting domain-containing protein [Candidatus Stahlbacteria bacterium]|nr:MAG: T9SS type A sorting domain-containing protein [Candidatus Stahlbacteria bacterium]